MSLVPPQTGDGSILGSAPVEPQEVIQLLKQKVTTEAVREYLKSLNPSYNGDPRNNDGGWKEVIFFVLKEGLVDKYGGQELFTGSRKKEKEFLLDFVWFQGLDENWAFRRAILGVEIEWWKGREEFLRNFGKLLCFRAPLKLFVYECPPKFREDLRRDLDNSLKKFEQHVRDECYVIVEFYRSGADYAQDARLWRAVKHSVAALIPQHKDGIATAMSGPSSTSKKPGYSSLLMAPPYLDLAHTSTVDTRHAKASVAKRLRSNALIGQVAAPNLGRGFVTAFDCASGAVIGAKNLARSPC